MDAEAALRRLQGSGLWMIIVFPLSPLVYAVAVWPQQRILRGTDPESALGQAYRAEMQGVRLALALWALVVAVVVLLAL